MAGEVLIIFPGNCVSANGRRRAPRAARRTLEWRCFGDLLTPRRDGLPLSHSSVSSWMMCCFLFRCGARNCVMKSDGAVLRRASLADLN